MCALDNCRSCNSNHLPIDDFPDKLSPTSTFNVPGHIVDVHHMAIAVAYVYARESVWCTSTKLLLNIVL